jgi:hypothetical protein
MQPCPFLSIGQPNEVQFACGIFTTDIPANEFCTALLLETADWSTVEIELGSDGKLTVL